MRNLLVINIPGLCPEHLYQAELLPNITSLAHQGSVAKLRPPIPAVTLPVQASLLTGTYPCEHGVVANGFFNKSRREITFWEQSADLVKRPRIWTRIRQERPDFKTAALFWQNIMFADIDVVVTPKPLHLEDRLISWCYSKPKGLYDQLASRFGSFPLHHYWGPLAGLQASKWITEAAIMILKQESPNLTLVYLPHLDYNTQRFGPDAPIIQEDIAAVDQLVGQLKEQALNTGEMDVMLFSEYSMSTVKGVVFPNLILREAGLLSVRVIEEKEYLDIELSKAVAMVDHQAAHIYCKYDVREEVKSIFEQTMGIDKVFYKEELGGIGLNHPKSGDLFLLSQPDHWFAYYWWPLEESSKAPPFAETVDIHRKPGYDPLELFMDPITKKIPLQPELIKGSHGHPDTPAVAIIPPSWNIAGKLEISTPTLGKIMEQALLVP